MPRTALAETIERQVRELIDHGQFDAAWFGIHDHVSGPDADGTSLCLAAEIRLRQSNPESLPLVQRAVIAAPDSRPAWQLFCHVLEKLESIPPDAVFISQIAHALGVPGIQNNGAKLAAMGVLTGQLATFDRADITVSPSTIAKLRTIPIGDAVYRLLLAFLVQGRVQTVPSEEGLTRVRYNFLRATGEDVDDLHQAIALDVMSALAIQCFYNEYVFAETGDERAAVDIFAQQIQEALVAGHRPDKLKVAAVAAYRPLVNFQNSSTLLDAAGSDSELFAHLLTIQITETLEERALKESIQSFNIVDSTSLEVRRQYEENPYPRWTHLYAGPRMAVELEPAARPRILIAGAGTGSHPLGTAFQNPQADIVALDLSLASLAYGARKARGYNVQNVTFVHGDILNVAELGMTFGHIASVGVIHHMAEPTKGLAALLGVLAPGGQIKLAIYTESGRRNVVAGIKLREQHALTSSTDDIRRFRSLVMKLDPTHPAASLVSAQDFFSMSECRDLVFHVQEHRFTLPMVKKMLDDLGLTLLKFKVSKGVQRQFDVLFSENAGRDLDCWTALEDQNPGIYGSMYRFTVGRTAEFDPFAPLPQGNGRNANILTENWGE